MRKKSGFTLIEAVITLAILTISTGLVVLVLNSLIRVQNASKDEDIANSELQTLDNMVNKYVSLVSQKTEIRDFEYDSSKSNSKTLVFTLDEDDYTLSYSNPNIVISTTYVGGDSSLSVSESKELTSISNVTFSYDPNLSLLIVNAVSRGIDNKYVYVVRVN